MPASSGSRESPAVKKVTLKRDSTRPSAARRSNHCDLLVGQPPIRLRSRPVDVSLVEHVVVVVGGHPQLGFDAYQRGILQGHTAKLEDGSPTDQLGDIPPVPPPLHPGKERTHRSLDQGAVVGRPEGFRITGALRVDHLWIEKDRQLDISLPEGGVAGGDDVDEHQHQERKPQENRGAPEVFEAAFGPIPAGKGGAHAFDGAFRQCCHDYSYCSRYLRTTCKATTFKPRVTTKSTRPNANAANVLALSNS